MGPGSPAVSKSISGGTVRATGPARVAGVAGAPDGPGDVWVGDAVEPLVASGGVCVFGLVVAPGDAGGGA